MLEVTAYILCSNPPEFEVDSINCVLEKMCEVHDRDKTYTNKKDFKI